MANSIRNVLVSNSPNWDPGRPELTICVFPRYVTETTEVRGRIVGPRCAYSTTVEVAYALQPSIERIQEIIERTGMIPMRCIIPEPNLWEPECPFLYEVVAELWQDGQRCDEARVRHALRRLQLKERGLLLNGRPLILRGLARNTCSEEDARLYRQVGCNLLLADANVGCETFWNEAERLGFFMIGRLPSPERRTLQQIVMKVHDKSITFGWLLSQDMLENPEVLAEILQTIPYKGKRAFGVELRRATYQPLLNKIGFVVCPASFLPQLTDISLPRIVQGSLPEKDVIPPPGVLGWID
jgi:hypothetical protein